MSYITVLLHHDADDWISRGIAFCSFSKKTSHCALASLDGTEVIESSAIGKPAGVRKVPFWEWAAKHPGYRVKHIYHPYPDLVWFFANKFLGRKYDWKYFLGWLVRRDWQDDAAFVCQELIELCCRLAGWALFSDETVLFGLTPAHIAMIKDYEGD